jgi:hypothetical protein
METQDADGLVQESSTSWSTNENSTDSSAEVLVADETDGEQNDLGTIVINVLGTPLGGGPNTLMAIVTVRVVLFKATPTAGTLPEVYLSVTIHTTSQGWSTYTTNPLGGFDMTIDLTDSTNAISYLKVPLTPFSVLCGSNLPVSISPNPIVIDPNVFTLAKSAGAITSGGRWYKC